MGKIYEHVDETLREFLQAQHVFFVGTAPLGADGHVNISPKGMGGLRVLGPKQVAYLDYPGSGIETVAHLRENGRIVLMFCAFEGAPLILRLYGTARVIHQNDQDWTELFSYFTPLPGARQIFDLTVELVQISCGFGVPYLSYKEERPLLADWAAKKGNEGMRNYWQEKNQVSIDNIPTHIIEKNIQP